MGRVTVEFELSNYADMVLQEAGYLDHVRRVTLCGVIDTSVMKLVLPQRVCETIGLPMRGQAVVSDAHVAFNGRGGVFSAIVKPTRSDALIGAIVMGDLDMIVDDSGQKVIPRDPDHILTELE